MYKEKIQQAIGILREKDVDMWLIFLRESETNHDPAIDLILGTSCTWASAFIITAQGKTIAIVGSLDKANIESKGLYLEVIGYVGSIREPLLETIDKINPNKIAINFSKNDVMSDGLTHGMYLMLKEYLEGSPFADRIISSEKIISALRGRKSPAELQRIRAVCSLTEVMFDQVTSFLKAGQTEAEIAAFLVDQAKKAGVELAWDPGHCPSVFSGPETAGAHFGPTERKTEKGHIMNIDFGIRKNDFCSDMQRTWYFLREGEKEIPSEVLKAFHAVRDAIQKAAEFIKPGVEGWQVDDVARSHITSLGYEGYPHALGHQIGRKAHDGAGLLCPRWERYGTLPFEKVEEGQVYTLEPRVTCQGHGIATMEEVIVVTKDGCEFLSHPQKDLWLIK
ncbi:MAG: Xaa-Pro peptidase family protein [Acidobacteriota bacterium]